MPGCSGCCQRYDIRRWSMLGLLMTVLLEPAEVVAPRSVSCTSSLLAHSVNAMPGCSGCCSECGTRCCTSSPGNGTSKTTGNCAFDHLLANLLPLVFPCEMLMGLLHLVHCTCQTVRHIGNARFICR